MNKTVQLQEKWVTSLHYLFNLNNVIQDDLQNHNHFEANLFNLYIGYKYFIGQDSTRRIFFKLYVYDQILIVT